MSYYLRAFCATDTLPSLRAVIEQTAARGITLAVDPEPPAELDDERWSQAAIQYKAERSPVLVEVNRAEDGDLLAEEIEEFVELLADAADSAAKDRVVAHVRGTRAIVAARLPGDVDDDGYRAVTALLDVFVDRCGALVQADGEGFYEGDRLIVEVD